MCHLIEFQMTVKYHFMSFVCAQEDIVLSLF